MYICGVKLFLVGLLGVVWYLVLFGVVWCLGLFDVYIEFTFVLGWICCVRFVWCCGVAVFRSTLVWVRYL